MRKNQGRIKQGYPGQGQEDKKMIKKKIKKRISKIEEKSGEDKKRIKEGYPRNFK